MKFNFERTWGTYDLEKFGGVQNGNEEYTIEVDNIDQLLEIARKSERKEIVISCIFEDKDGLPTLEIYDNPRE